MWLSLRADFTILGSAVKMPSTSVKISQLSAFSAAASATAVVSDPPRPRVVTSRSSVTPWKPATTGTLPPLSSSRMRSGLMAWIRAREWCALVRRRIRVDAARKRDHAVGGVSHRGHDDDHLLSAFDRLRDAPADAPDASGGPHRGTAVLLNDHRVLNIPLSVTRVTRGRP